MDVQVEIVVVEFREADVVDPNSVIDFVHIAETSFHDIPGDGMVTCRDGELYFNAVTPR